MQSIKQCVVVFPVYRSLKEQERLFLQQGVRMTQGFKKVFIAPESFIFDDSFKGLEDIEIQRFPDTYFKGVTGYNELMLSPEFYRRFSDYEYILIHQTDVYLFQPQLKCWCDKGYDYIGAPWMKPKKLKRERFYRFILKYIPGIYSAHKRQVHECYNEVGNGGLSLRKTATFIQILESTSSRKKLELYKEKLKTDTLYNEDIFFSIEGPRLFRGFRKPKWNEAAPFAMETYVSYLYEHTGNSLPFGCHAPAVYEPSFWEKFIPVKFKKDE